MFFSSPGSAKMSFWDSPVSVVWRLSFGVCRVSTFSFKHLLQNCLLEFHETLTEASLGHGEQTIQNGILILAFVWLPWQPKEKS